MRSWRELTFGIAFVVLAAAVACNGDDTATTSDPLSCEVGYEDFAGPFLLNWCVGCHSSSLAKGERQKAPETVNFDTLEGVRAHADKIRAMAVDSDLMPPVGGPSAKDRELLGKWLDCGMPAKTDGFTPPAPSTLPDAGPAPTGTCAEPRAPLPEAMLPRCKASTLDCVVQCGLTETEYTLEDCRNACLAADGTPAGYYYSFPVDCPTCTYLQLIACADAGGCHDETAAFMCCLEGCGSDQACQASQCSGELQAFGLCVYYSAPECIEYTSGPINACFAESDPAGAGGAPGEPAAGAGGI